MPLQPAPWQLEHIKRRLGEFAARIAPCRSLLLLQAPAAEDIATQLRLEGLQALCDAQGIALRLARPGEQPGAEALGMWLGGKDALLPPAVPRLLVWPAPEQAAAMVIAMTEAGRQPLLLCLPDGAAQSLAQAAGLERSLLLPDPLHALFGLLDCHPAGEGAIEVAGAEAAALLPAGRLQWLARLQAAERSGFGSRAATRLARRRVLESLRRLLVRHRAVQASESATAILGLMLGREVRTRGAAATALPGYWACWGEPLS